MNIHVGTKAESEQSFEESFLCKLEKRKFGGAQIWKLIWLLPPSCLQPIFSWITIQAAVKKNKFSKSTPVVVGNYADFPAKKEDIGCYGVDSI